MLTRVFGNLNTKSVIASLVVGIVSGVIAVSSVMSFAFLIFSGELTAHISTGIGLVLFSGLVASALTGLLSSSPGIIAAPQDGPTPILAILAASIVAQLHSASLESQIIPTVVAAIALTTLITGIIFFSFGRLKVGRLIRYIPYPVVGGFIAGTGLLMLKGSVAVMANTTISVSHFLHLFQPQMLIHWVPGLFLGCVLLITLRRYSHFLVMPSFLVTSIGLFYVILMITGTSIADAISMGWLLQSPQNQTLWRPLSLESLSLVNWSAIFSQSFILITITLVSLVQFLLYVSGLELIIRRDMDLNHELKAAGIANIVSSLGGGLISYHWLGLSSFAFTAGAKTRLVGIITASIFGVALLVGSSIISVIPIPVLGGLLAFFGISFLIQWLYDGWFKLSRSDYFIVLLILTVISFFGFLEGVGVGIVAAVILFAVKYSRIEVVKHFLSGTSYQSNLHRPQQHRRILLENGEKTFILKLQGFIFFGTANNLLNQVRKRLDNPDLPKPHFMLLDFRQVSGLDSSALHSFVRIQQLSEEKNIKLIFTNLGSKMREQFEKEGFSEKNMKLFFIFSDLDYGVEWCENQILDEKNINWDDELPPLQKQLEEHFTTPSMVSRLLEYLELEEFEAGYQLIRQGDLSEELYFIESGQLTVYLELHDGKTIRLSSLRAGIFVGEVGMYMKDIRTASVVTDKPSLLYRLTSNSLVKMRENDPDLASEFHHFVVRLLGERLARTNKTLKALLD